MKTMPQNTPHKLPLLMGVVLLAAMVGTPGCATKGARNVYAQPAASPGGTGPVRAVTANSPTDAPRTEPGKVMDPEALTYAQVPARIIYLPGQHGYFGRTSARQEVAFNLQPVSRIAEIQAQGTPAFIGDDATGVEERTFAWSVMDSDGSTRKGMARALEVRSQDRGQKNRAEAMLRRGETLEWNEQAGWVAFRLIETLPAFVEPKPIQDANIPVVEESDEPVKPPEIEEPKTGGPNVDKPQETPKDGEGAKEELDLEWGGLDNTGQNWQ